MTNTQLIEWVVWAEQVSRDIIDAEFCVEYGSSRIILTMSKWNEHNREYCVRENIDFYYLERKILNDRFNHMMRLLIHDMVIARQDELEG